jgi:hypothetical protein
MRVSIIICMILSLVGCATVQKTKMVGAGFVASGITMGAVTTGYSVPVLDTDRGVKSWAVALGVSAAFVALGAILMMDGDSELDKEKETERVLQQQHGWMYRLSDRIKALEKRKETNNVEKE